MYILGKTGSGKSTLLGVLAYQDILNGEGFALVDPHGDLVEQVRGWMPKHRQHEVIYFDVPDAHQGICFNPLEDVPRSKHSLVASGLLEAFKKLWADAWGVRLEHILRNALLTLLEQPGATLADILRLLDDKDYRAEAVKRTANPQVKRFWKREYEKYTWRYRADAIAPIQNKVSSFLTDPLLRRILTEPETSLNLRRIMDEGKVLLVNLAKGKIGEDSAALLGALLVSQIGSTGLSRSELPETERRDFFVYLDEFQTFTTKSLADMLSELRKYRVNLILANQYLSQVQEGITDAILGNVGTLITFRLGPSDATFIGKEFYPVFEPVDLMNLPNHSIYLKLMIDGAVSKPFSGNTITKETLDSINFLV